MGDNIPKCDVVNQVGIATRAMVEMLRDGSISQETMDTANKLGISPARLDAMVEFIQRKGPPEELVMTVAELAKRGGGFFMAFGFVYYVSVDNGVDPVRTYEVGAACTERLVFYIEPKMSGVDLDLQIGDGCLCRINRGV